MPLEFNIEIDDEVTALDSSDQNFPIVMAFDRSARVEDVDGHLVVEGCNISKANVCPYLGSEIPNAAELRLDPARIYYLYRDAAELEAAAKTYERKPLMMRHVVVSADSPQKFMIVGTVSNVRFSHPYLKADLSVWDAEAIRAIANGAQKELSCGYRYVADMTPGEIDGVKYDGRMKGLHCNHVALVSTGRAGPDVQVADELPEGFASMKKSALLAALAPFLAADADKVALDAAILALAADKKAKDADPEKDDEAKAQDAKAAADKAAADKAAKDGNWGLGGKDDEEELDEPTADELPDAPEGGAPKPGKPNGKPAVDAKGMDSATVASVVKAALAERDALHTARREVESIIGTVAYDSAADVYKAALVKLGVAVDGVDASAFPALLKMAKDKAVKPVVATDSAAIQSMSKAFPGLDRFSK